MISDKVSEIISMLIDTTKSDELSWTHATQQGLYNNEAKLSSLSEDELSKFEVSVKYVMVSDRWEIESQCGLWIRNIELPGGSMYVTSHAYPSIINLRDILNRKYCSSIKPSSDLVEDKLSQIYKSISKSSFREKIISKIFNG